MSVYFSHETNLFIIQDLTLFASNILECRSANLIFFKISVNARLWGSEVRAVSHQRFVGAC